MQSDILDDITPIDMKPLFYPKTIAVIGVSKNKVSGMKFVFANTYSGYIKSGGKVFPINPKYQELYGYKVYPSLFDAEVPSIDLAIIAVPAKFVPGVVRDCGKKGVKFCVIFSSGFGESGNEEYQHELEKAVNEVKHITRFIGPNCLGIDNPYSKVSYFPNMPSAKGNISYVAMSGGTTSRLACWMVSQGQGFHNIVSIGNSVDLTASDFVNYFREDPLTDVICLYLESIPNGRRFMNALKATTVKKPVILWKGGQSDIGREATQSHTGGLAGSIEIWRAMAKQYGVVTAHHFENFADIITAFSVDFTLPRDENVCILVCGGGIAVEYTDLCARYGLKIPELTPTTQDKLADVFPDVNTNFRNPLDLGEYGYIPDYFNKALRIVAADPNISSIIFVREAERFQLFQETLGMDDMEELTVDLLSKAAREIDKPLFCCMSPNSQEIPYYEARLRFKKKLIQINIPVIDLVPNICETIKKMVAYRKYLVQKMGESPKGT